MVSQKMIERRVAYNALLLGNFTTGQLERNTGLISGEITPVLQSLMDRGYIQKTSKGYALSDEPEMRLAMSKYIDSLYTEVESDPK